MGFHQAQTLTLLITLYILEKTNVTSNPNIGSLKTAIEEEWNKMSEEFILKLCKSFRRGFDYNYWKKNGGRIV